MGKPVTWPYYRVPFIWPYRQIRDFISPTTDCLSTDLCSRLFHNARRITIVLESIRIETEEVNAEDFDAMMTGAEVQTI